MTEHDLGPLERKVMYGILRLSAKAYGLAIQKEIFAEFDHEPSIGAIYTVLDRLEHKGWVKCRIGEPTPERGGRARKYFTLTGAGQAAYDRAERDSMIMRAGWSPQGA
jgi:DNA-binding PadR family transcriptional regulator